MADCQHEGMIIMIAEKAVEVIRSGTTYEVRERDRRV